MSRAAQDGQASVPVGAVSPTVVALTALVVLPAGLIVGAEVAHALDVASFWAMIGFGFVVVALVVGVGTASWRSVRIARLTRHEALWWFAMGIVALVTFVVVFKGQWRVPSSRGVDLAHHGAITAWIREHQSFPTRRVPQLDEYSTYPTGAHVVAATVAWISGLPALSATWLVGLCALFVSLLLQAAIVARLAGGRWLVSLSVPVLSLLAWRFTVGMLSWDQFFAQAVGLTLLVAALFVVVVAEGAVAPRAWLPLAVLLCIAAIVTFPSQAAVAPGLLVGAGAALAAKRVARPLRPLRRVLAATVACLGVLIASAVIIGRRVDFSRRTLAGHGEGEVARLTLRTAGGWPIVLLGACGLVFALNALRRHDVGAAAVLGALAAPVLTASAFLSLRHGFPTRIPIYNYRILKNAYTAAPFVVILASYAVAEAILGFPTNHRNRTSTTPARQPRARGTSDAIVGLASLVVALALVWQPTYRSNAHDPVLTGRQLAFAEHIAHTYPRDEIAIVGRDLAPFLIWWTSVRRSVDPSTGFVPMVDRTIRWESWPDDTSERYLLAIGEPFVSSVSGRAGVSVVERSGDAVLFERLRGGF